MEKRPPKKPLKVVGPASPQVPIVPPTGEAGEAAPPPAFTIAKLEAQLAACALRTDEHARHAAACREELASSRRWWRRVDDEVAKLRALVTLAQSPDGADASRGVALLLDPIATNLMAARDQGLGLIQSPNYGARPDQGVK